MTNNNNRFHVITGLIAIVALFQSGCAPLEVNQPTRIGQFFGKSRLVLPASHDAPANDSSSSEQVSEAQSGKYTQAIARLNENAEASENAKAIVRQHERQLDQIAQAQLMAIERQETARNDINQQEVVRREMDVQAAYEQGRFDAMQVAYQQPMSRTYSNPPHPQPLFNSNYPPNMAPYQEQMPYANQQQRDYQPEQQYDHTLDINPPSSAPSSTPAPSISQEAYEHQPQEIDLSPPSLRQTTSNTSRNMRSTGHFANGMNFAGSELRHQVKTATEVAFDLQDENANLRQQLKLRDAKVELLLAQIETQDQTIVHTQDVLTKSNRLAVLHREKIAQLKVSIQDLEKEKIAIELNADKALNDIESMLDSVLLNSISKK